MDDRPTVEELEQLYASLTQEERDQLLQELLVAAAHGGDTVLAVIGAWMVDRAGGELLDGSAAVEWGRPSLSGSSSRLKPR